MKCEEISSYPAFKIGHKDVGFGHPAYFIADIAANHNGDLNKAKHLIELAKEAGADAAKFQHFQAKNIVSDFGFKSMGGQQSHQSKWNKSVFEVYQDASVPWKWAEELKKHCDAVGIEFFSAPYDLAAIDMLDAFMPAYKVGSGDITWLESLERMASKKKPILLATGASTLEDVKRAVSAVKKTVSEICVMQCNTNYTGSLENFQYIHLNVLKTFRREFPDCVLGLSDHTPGHATVLGAVTLGARVIEKHFTDQRDQEGPDHAFSMDPKDWRDMVDRTRELEFALGGEIKKIEENEAKTVLIQRRCLRAAHDIQAGEILKKEDVEPLRPVKEGAYLPYDIQELIGKKVNRSLKYGEAMEPSFLD